MCGFKHPEVISLLELSKSSGASASVFAKIKDLDDLSDSRLATLRRVGLDIILRAMVSICPSDPAGAFRVIRDASQFDEAMGTNRQLEEVKQLPFVVGLVKKHSVLTDKDEQDALLALISPFYSYKLMKELFGVSHSAVERSRMFAAHEECKLFRDKVLHERCRWDPRKFAYLSQWTQSIYAVKVGDASSDNLQRLQIRARLYPLYVEYNNCGMEGVDAASEDKFNKFMSQGFADTSEETCCCGQCVDGFLAMSNLQEFIEDVNIGLIEVKERCKQVDEIRRFMNTDFRWKHLQHESVIATHCMKHALANHARCQLSGCNHDHNNCAEHCYGQRCQHDHTNSCAECLQWDTLVCAVREEIQRNANTAATESPPVNAAPTESPPVIAATAGPPRVDTAAAESPPVNAAAAESPPVDTAVAGSPPVNAAAAESPPVGTAIAESPPVDTAVAGSPPVNAAAAESPPVDTTIAESPPIIAAAAESLLVNAAAAAESPRVNVAVAEPPPVNAAAAEELECNVSYLDRLHAEFCRYRSHVVKKHAASMAKLEFTNEIIAGGDHCISTHDLSGMPTLANSGFIG